MISSAGYRIGPFEVESTLKEHPAVLESAAVGSPDQSRNEIVKAFIVLTSEYVTDDATKLLNLATELQNFCKKNAAPYKYPREVSPCFRVARNVDIFSLCSGPDVETVDRVCQGFDSVQDGLRKDPTWRAEKE